MPVSNSIPYIKECIKHTVDIFDELKLIEANEIYSDLFKNTENKNPEDIERTLTIVKYLKTAQHNTSLIANRIDLLIKESDRYIRDNCEHEFVRDYTYSWDSCGPTPKSCKKCGISNC